jgi:hypothetical protein
VKSSVKLTRFCGRADKNPRVIAGDLSVMTRVMNGRDIRIVTLTDASAPAPLLASLYEPQILHWITPNIRFSGWENNAGQWTVQVWECEIDR